MSMHKAPSTELELEGLRAHGLATDTPSQLSDAFRQGVKWALEQSAPERVGVPVGLLQDLVANIEDRTCTHDSTHRGGAIWEICDDCGDRWADDMGGKPEFKWPDCVEKARALLASHQRGEANG